MTQPSGGDPCTATPPGHPFAAPGAPAPSAGTLTAGAPTAPPVTVPPTYGPWAPPVAGDRPPMDAWSVVSLVTSTLGLTLVGVVCGVVGLVRTSGGRRRGRLLAAAGIVVAVLVTMLQALVLAAVWPAVVAGFEAGAEAGAEVAEAEAAADTGPEQVGEDAADAESVPYDELGVGHCFQDPETETFYDVVTVPCTQPHDAEVVALVELDGTTWPGDDVVGEQAWDACMVAAADALEAAGVDGTDYEYWTFTPTRESWLLYGDREVACLAYGLDGPLDAPVLP